MNPSQYRIGREVREQGRIEASEHLVSGQSQLIYLVIAAKYRLLGLRFSRAGCASRLRLQGKRRKYILRMLLKTY